MCGNPNMSTTATEQGSILIVDDNPLITNVVKGLLTAENYRVHTCANGSEALGVLQDKKVDVGICDVMMPEMDGYALQHKLRENAELAHIPFVFLTALSDVTERTRGLESGADEYLMKPFEPRDLLSVVKGKVLRSNYLRTMAEHKYESYRKKVLHTLSHEFRTPLVAINTGAELLIESRDALEQKKVVALLEAIRRGGQRLEKLVNDFMLLQQIDAGVAQRLFTQKAAPYDLASIAELVTEQVASHAQSDGYVVHFKNLVEHALVQVYEPQVQDILSRLLQNAIKFSAKVKEIEVVVMPHDVEVAVEVRDRGIGLDVTKVKEACDAFGQINRERLEQQGGGLGLAIANRYAVINGGRLEFESRPDGGSVVSLILPLISVT